MELNDILRIFFSQNSENYITINGNVVHLNVWRDYFYDNRGGYEIILWYSDLDSINHQPKETRELIDKYILVNTNG